MTHVTVSAPSRLHFGLYAFGGVEHAFGGVGVMVESPRLVLHVQRADDFRVSGLLQPRTKAFAKKVGDFKNWPELPACHLEVASAPPEHSGLGVGTQLGLGVAAALHAFVDGDVPPAAELARSVQRGRRSAIGTHGFDGGGFIVDGGHHGQDAIGERELQTPLPDAWRFLLVTPATDRGLSGQPERDAFATLPSIEPSVTGQLRRLALEEMAPAVQTADYERFATALYKYGHRAGECFASVQGGPFASPAIATLVERLRDLGAIGCGQSSWGPTVFALAPTVTIAQRWRNALRADPAYEGATLTIARGDNEGARVQIATPDAAINSTR